MPTGTQGSSGQVPQLCPGHRISSCCLNWALTAWHLLQPEAWSNPSLLMCLREKGSLIRKMNILYMQWNLDWTDLLTHLLAQQGMDAGAKISCWGLCPFTSIKKHSRIPAIKDLLLFQREVVHLPWRHCNCGMGELLGQEWEKGTRKRKNCTFGGASGTGA